MAGIYLHIPFCHKACHYCDFHFSVSLRNKAELLQAMQQELERERDYLAGERVRTIYFGGGTPSLLRPEELAELLRTVYRFYDVDPAPEICLEANPEQLDLSYLREIKSLGINRLSIGVQSFDTALLNWMNRSHSAAQSVSSILAASEVGFRSISVDLIYGIPGLDDVAWERTVQHALQLPIDHLSAYSLTLEERTPYAHFVRKGSHAPPDELRAEKQFRILREHFDQYPWEQYEISNFAKNGAYSKHNLSYWQGVPYLGVGPSAHSFNGHSRAWNRSSNAVYIQAMNQGESVREQEVLTAEDRFNEYLMTGLRTKWGVQRKRLEQQYAAGSEAESQLAEHIRKGWMEEREGSYVLTEEGMLRADGISASLFVDHSSQRSS